jgi:IS30 family transposase
MPVLESQAVAKISSRLRPNLADAASGEIMQRAAALLPDDKLLLEMTVVNRLSFAQIARLLGVPPGTVCRRLQRVTARLHDPLVIFLLDRICPLSAEHRQLGVEHFLQGKSVRQLSELHQMRDHQVRRILEYIKGWHRGMSWRGGKR